MSEYCRTCGTHISEDDQDQCAACAKPKAHSLRPLVSQRDGLEIAIIGLASVYPEDALKVFTTDEITAMGKRHEHLADYECFELLKAALTNDKVERP